MSDVGTCQQALDSTEYVGIIDFSLPGLGSICGSCGCIVCATIVFGSQEVSQIISTAWSKE
eukprot:scaffold295829_cov35-Attheya_sp.AAC.1